ncbi:5-methylthioadenosine/S-adenosylhomocysteine deaminase/8-oxoguanine deaminase [Actinocorallia herbida]|uniref:5-methylthioadenosine/S-adenosylhomocysteine deaminase/8-oxoguanine deaminase n=1 Tax=Actinocorallia herbida TaxID=58109 RepID=A0A3N1D132_9ACTN|nr:amidohydrolase family protein [Actinocorallia herbida]ROO87232.1 5-methylthioadenosine/S-adenosylhomocysteine deaminase/8-oxoguanine deaminase [Actinocorallia herbida]
MTRPPADGPLLLRCRTLVADAASAPLADAGVLVDATGTVTRVAPYALLADKAPAARTEVLDGVVLPAFTDAHSHLRALPLAEQDVADADLESWVVRLTGATALDPGDDALVAADGLTATGVTTVQAVHHTFAGPEEYTASVTAVARELVLSGLRAQLAVGLTDQAEFSPETASGTRGTPAAPHRGLRPDRLPPLLAGLLRSAGRWPGVRIALAPVAPQWCSDEALDALRRCAADGVRLHTHLLESPHQRGWLADGDDPVARLDRHRLLGPGTSAAHGVWLTDAETALLAERGTALVHCPTSNLRLGSGDARVRSWLDAGAAVALGLDSQHQGPPDMFAEMRAALAAAERAGGPLTSREVLAMATEGGAAATGNTGRLGRIAPGHRADLVCVAVPGGIGTDPVEHVVHEATHRDVSDVLRAGRWLVGAGVTLRGAEANAARTRLRAALFADRAARARRMAALAPTEAALRALLDDTNTRRLPPNDRTERYARTRDRGEA